MVELREFNQWIITTQWIIEFNMITENTVHRPHNYQNENNADKRTSMTIDACLWTILSDIEMKTVGVCEAGILNQQQIGENLIGAIK